MQIVSIGVFICWICPERLKVKGQGKKMVRLISDQVDRKQKIKDRNQETLYLTWID